MARAQLIEDTKGQQVVTPKGKALWVKINEPDTFYDEVGSYLADMVVDVAEDATQEFFTKMEKLRDKALKEVKSKLSPAKVKTLIVKDVFHEELDKAGDPTGRTIIKTKLRAQYRDKNGVMQDSKVQVYNEKGIEQEGFSKLIANDSIIKCQVWASPYYMAALNTVGVTYKLKKIQYIELIEYASNGDGFSDESGDGFDEADSDGGNDDNGDF